MIPGCRQNLLPMPALLAVHVDFKERLKKPGEFLIALDPRKSLPPERSPFDSGPIVRALSCMVKQNS